MLFHRSIDSKGVISLDGLDSRLNKEEKEILKVLANARSNQLLLHLLADLEISVFSDVYNWFQKKLVILHPDTRLDYSRVISSNKLATVEFCELLREFDLDVSSLIMVPIPLYQLKGYLPEFILTEVEKMLKKNPDKPVITSGSSKGFFRIQMDKKGELQAEKIGARTKYSDEVYFDFTELSDGTLRIFDFIPMLLELRNNDSTFLIDEIGRSLHPMLVKKLLQVYLEMDKRHDEQLIATTHSDYLLNFDSVRKDEIWFVEKKWGASKLIPLSEYRFENRTDRNLRNDYLKGRYGGIPVLR